MKKSIKIFSVLMMAIMMIMVATPVFAAVNASGVIDGVDKAIDYTDDTDVTARIGNIIGFLQWIGIAAGVVILVIFGLKYMMGSLEEKAEYKKTMIPFIVGAVVLMLAPQLAKLIFNIFA